MVPNAVFQNSEVHVPPSHRRGQNRAPGNSENFLWESGHIPVCKSDIKGADSAASTLKNPAMNQEISKNMQMSNPTESHAAMWKS